ncbi:MAG: PPC domain-containing protein, partial [Chloroflexi bacterium]|nr:PPC domain-containing protein [Chloroflexota bacterium]
MRVPIYLNHRFRFFTLCLVLALLAGGVFSAAAQNVAEAEPNDNFGLANAISLNSAVSGAINPTRDADWYTFTVERHGELRLQVSGVAAELDINLRVWNGNKDVLTNWYAPLAKGGATDALVDLPAPGRYYLEVRDGGDDASSSQPYTLSAAYTPSADGNEPNNDFNQAAPLAFDQPTAATILPVRDVDWYVVTVDHHGELRLHITDVPAELDIALRVWNGNKDVLTNWYTPLAKGGDTDAVVDLPAPGRYYVEVRDGSDDARSIQPFTLTASFTPSPDAFEPNNDFGSAANLVLGQSLQATILPVRDVDWFTFDVATHGELRVEVSAVPAELDVVLRVWNGNKDVLTNWYTPLAKGGNTSAVVDLPAPGRYVLEVRDGSDDARSVQPFTLRADFTPSPDGFEPNNDFGSAASVGVDRSVQATILPVRDADWFAFDAAHHGELRVQASNVPAEMDVVYRLWNSNKDVLTNWYAPLAKGGNTDGVIDLAAPGRYFLEVRDGSDDARSIQPYTLSTKFIAAADKGEPNNSQETATPVNLDETIPGNILPAGDRDWCRIEVTQAGDLHILVTNVAPELAIAFRLWDDKGTVLTNWFRPLSQGGNTEAVVPIATPGVYFVEVADNSSSARSIQPYLLRFSMSPIDPATMTLPTPPVDAGAPVTGTAAITPTTGATILTSGQVGPLGAELFVQEPRNPDVDGARLSVPPGSLDRLETVHISASDSGPEGAPFGLQPAGPYWYFDPDGLTFTQPVTVTLPVPTGAAEAEMFVGHWTGSAWEELGG